MTWIVLTIGIWLIGIILVWAFFRGATRYKRP